MRWKRAENLAQRCYLRSLRSFVEKLATKQQFPAPWISARSSRPGNFLGRLTPKKSTLWLIAEILGWLAWVTSWLIIATRCCNASSLRQAAVVYGGDSSHCILVDAYRRCNLLSLRETEPDANIVITASLLSPPFTNWYRVTCHFNYAINPSLLPLVTIASSEIGLTGWAEQFHPEVSKKKADRLGLLIWIYVLLSLLSSLVLPEFSKPVTDFYGRHLVRYYSELIRRVKDSNRESKGQ